MTRAYQRSPISRPTCELDNMVQVLPSENIRVSISLPHLVIVRAPGLLPMWYTPSEIQEELGVDARQVRDWIKCDLPHRRDERGHIWIDGRQLAAWIAVMKNSRKRPTTNSGEAYCVRCNQVVEMLEPKAMHQGKRSYLQGTCSHCKTQIYRGIKNGQSD